MVPNNRLVYSKGSEQLPSVQPLPNRYLDQALKGNMSGYREYHIKPDLILIYRKFEDGTL